MALLGSLIAIGAALAFAVIGGLLIWGSWNTLNQEVPRGFVSVPPSAVDRLLTLGVLVIPSVAAAVLSLLGAWRILLVALGAG